MLDFLKNLFTSNKTQKRDALGDRGENMAARHLQKLGYKIIVRNFRCEMGEMKVVMNQLASALAALYQITAAHENHQLHIDTDISTVKNSALPD